MSNELEQAADQLLTFMVRLRRLTSTDPPPQAAGLSPSLMAIIDFVATSPQCGVKEIAKGLQLSAPTVSVSVRHLEDAGFLERQPHPRDKRAVQLSLTEKGRSLYEQTIRFRRQTFERLLASLTVEEQKTLLTLLKKALTTLENEKPTPTKGDSDS